VAANDAGERAETLEGDGAALGNALGTVKADAAEPARLHEDEIEVLQTDHAEQLCEQRRHADDIIADIERTAQAAVEEVSAGRNRAEGAAGELRTELAGARRRGCFDLATRRPSPAAT
jgi:hypothetical protein